MQRVEKCLTLMTDCRLRANDITQQSQSTITVDYYATPAAAMAWLGSSVVFVTLSVCLQIPNMAVTQHALTLR